MIVRGHNPLPSFSFCLPLLFLVSLGALALPWNGDAAEDSSLNGRKPNAPARWLIDNNRPQGHFGFAAGAGDFNGDGYTDLVVGARVYPQPYWRGGRVSAYYGGASGLDTRPAWDVYGEYPEHRFGEAVASAGDVNGDGFDDLLAGSWMHGKRRGLARLYLGSPHGVETNAAWEIEGDIEGLSLGSGVASAGDVNGDGFSDVLIGATYMSEAQRQRSRVFAFYGSRSGLRSVPDWSFQLTVGARMGEAMASAGDVNRDGFDDIVIGAPGHRSRGAVAVFHGSAEGLSKNPAALLISEVRSANFGRAVSGAGDINGDGFDDVIVGAPTSTLDRDQQGQVFVFAGSPTGLRTQAVWTAVGQTERGMFGRSVSTAGDVNRDGFADVIIGESLFAGVNSNYVGAHVFLGSPSGLSTNIHWSRESLQGRAEHGVVVGSAGDVNKDGYSDVIFSSWLHKDENENEGRVYVFAGSAEGLLDSALPPSASGLPIASIIAPATPLPTTRFPWGAVAAGTGAIVLLTGLVRYVSTRGLRLRLRQVEAAHALEMERARIARDIHDGLGANLTRIALLSELLKDANRSSETTRANAERLAATARELAGTVDEMVWAANPAKDALEHFASYLTNYAQEFLAPTTIRCRLEIPEKLPNRRISSEARHSLFLVAKEALNNAVKHASAHELWIRLSLRNGTLTLCIQDDGKGFDPNAVSSDRNGLGNMRHRVLKLGGELIVETRPGAGTRIDILLPLNGGLS